MHLFTFLTSVTVLILLADNVAYSREKKNLISFILSLLEIKIKSSSSHPRHYLDVLTHNNHQVPLIWGSRVFMAIDLSISPHQVEERKVAVKLISVKSHEFTGTKKEVKDLHEKLLCHFMHARSQDSQWNIGGLGLNLDGYFNRKARAKLYVHLSRANILPDDTPIFYSYGDFM
jgi:hypothetical protein